jgi:hypothetical protein
MLLKQENKLIIVLLKLVKVIIKNLRKEEVSKMKRLVLSVCFKYLSLSGNSLRAKNAERQCKILNNVLINKI